MAQHFSTLAAVQFPRYLPEGNISSSVDALPTPNPNVSVVTQGPQ
jgi:hypothetical protein